MAEAVDQLYQEILTAGTKWNFLPFRLGLVGGHCIGVDPCYLTYKAQEVGYHPKVILSGRHTRAPGQYAAIILAVGHHPFIELGEDSIKA